MRYTSYHNSSWESRRRHGGVTAGSRRRHSDASTSLPSDSASATLYSPPRTRVVTATSEVCEVQPIV